MCPTSRSPRPEEPMMNNVAVSKLCDLASHWNTPVLSPFCPNKSGPFFVPFDTAIQRYQQNLEASCFLNLETCWEMHSTLNELYYWGILKCQQGSCSRSQRPRVRLLVNPNAMGLTDHLTRQHCLMVFLVSRTIISITKTNATTAWLPMPPQETNTTEDECREGTNNRVACTYGIWILSPRDAVRGLRQCVLAPKKAEADSWGHHIS